MTFITAASSWLWLVNPGWHALTYSEKRAALGTARSFHDLLSFGCLCRYASAIELLGLASHGWGCARPNVDVKVDKKTGLVIPETSGLSVHVDQQKLLGRFDTAPRVKSIPDELQILQQGRDPGHYGITSRQTMTPEQFQDLLNQVEFES